MSLIEHDEILRQVAKCEDYLVEQTLTLIRCEPSYDDPSFTGIKEAQSHLSDQFSRLGLLVEQGSGSHIPPSDPLLVDASQIVPHATVGWQATHPFIIGTLPSDSAESLVLAGHIDVEPVDSDSWERPSRARGEVADGRIYGRGAADMLSSFAAYLTALRVALYFGTVTRRVGIHSVSNEELGGNGTLALLRGSARPKDVVLGEPSDSKVCTSSLGFHHFQVVLSGASGHMASIATGQTSIDLLPLAIFALTEVRSVLAQRIRRSPGFSGYTGNPLTIGMIRAGRVPAVPPLTCVLDLTVYSAPGDSYRDIEQVLRQYLGTDGRITISAMELSFPGNLPRVGRSFSQALGSARFLSSGDAFGGGFPSPCDMRLYTEFGAEAVVWGPGRLQEAHGPDEWVDLAALRRYTAELVCLILTSELESKDV